MSKNLKIKVNKNKIVPILWVWNLDSPIKEKLKLDVFEKRTLRRILMKYWLESLKEGYYSENLGVGGVTINIDFR
jgi:hypothetical protein